MSLLFKILCLGFVLFGCQSPMPIEQEVYTYILENLEVKDAHNSAFILQNPGSPCGACINTGNNLAQIYPAVPTITTLSRHRLITSSNCIIDTAGGVFDLLPSSFISYVLIKKDHELEFIPLEQKNQEIIAKKFEALSLN